MRKFTKVLFYISLGLTIVSAGAIGFSLEQTLSTGLWLIAAWVGSNTLLIIPLSIMGKWKKKERPGVANEPESLAGMQIVGFVIGLSIFLLLILFY